MVLKSLADIFLRPDFSYPSLRVDYMISPSFILSGRITCKPQSVIFLFKSVNTVPVLGCAMTGRQPFSGVYLLRNLILPILSIVFLSVGLGSWLIFDVYAQIWETLLGISTMCFFSLATLFVVDSRLRS